MEGNKSLDKIIGEEIKPFSDERFFLLNTKDIKYSELVSNKCISLS